MKNTENIKSFYFTIDKTDYIITLEYSGLNKQGFPTYKAYILSIDTSKREQKTIYLKLKGHFLPVEQEAEQLIKAYHQTRKARA